MLHASTRPVAAAVAAAVVFFGPAPLSRAGDCTPPLNEDCENAIVFTTADLPFEISAPLGCFNDVIDKPYFDVFYRYDCTVTAEHLIHMCDSSGDTYIRIYGAGCGWGDGVELATADDECPGSPPNADPLLSIALTAGATYWIELGTWRPDPPWAPPPNSPYLFHVSIPGTPAAVSCDGTNLRTALVGEPGNPPDTNGLGAVADLLRMATLEVTNGQYVEFLNSVAADDPNELFSEDMTDSDRGGILRLGGPGSFTYVVKANFGDKPVNFVSWSDAARFCNWLHNGRPQGAQGPATTESGAYDMAQPLDQIDRLVDARWFLPTHDEWYKAAYYDPFDPAADGNGTPDYWLYPTRSDTLPAQAQADAVGNVANPGASVANYDKGADWNGENGNVTTAGSATSVSPWGLLDSGGNVYEMTETPDTPIPPDGLPTRTGRGGDFASSGLLMSSPAGFSIALNMVAEAANVGFRPATTLCPGDFDGDNDVDAEDRATFEACFTGPDGGPVDALCAIGDFDGDGDVDCADWAAFTMAWTDLEPPEAIEACGPVPVLSPTGLAVLSVALAVLGAMVIARRPRAGA